MALLSFTVSKPFGILEYLQCVHKCVLYCRMGVMGFMGVVLNIQLFFSVLTGDVFFTCSLAG